VRGPGFNGHQSRDRQLLLFAANVRAAAELLLSPTSHLAMHLSQYLRTKEGRDVNGNSIPQPEQIIFSNLQTDNGVIMVLLRPTG
jgi:hypothetical protein